MYHIAKVSIQPIYRNTIKRALVAWGIAKTALKVAKNRRYWETKSSTVLTYSL